MNGNGNISLSYCSLKTKFIDNNIAFSDYIRRLDIDDSFGLSSTRRFSIALEPGDDKLF